MNSAELTQEENRLVLQLAEWAKAYNQLQGGHFSKETVSLGFHLDGLRNMVLARAAHRTFEGIPEIILESEQLE